MYVNAGTDYLIDNAAGLEVNFSEAFDMNSLEFRNIMPSFGIMIQPSDSLLDAIEKYFGLVMKPVPD